MPSFLVCGYPGSGKSTSIFPNKSLGIKGLDPTKTMFINCAGDGKRILYPNWREVFQADKKPSEGGRYYADLNPSNIVKLVKYVLENRPDIKYIIIDDANLVMGMTVLGSTKKMERDDWATMAKNTFPMFNLVNDPLLKARPDVFLIFTMHLMAKDTYKESLGDIAPGATKHVLATAGQMINNNVPIASMFDIILTANTKFDPVKNEVRYFFETKPFENTPSRSPHGMFDEYFTSPGIMPNDMGKVVDAICKFDGIIIGK